MSAEVDILLDFTRDYMVRAAAGIEAMMFWGDKTAMANVAVKSLRLLPSELGAMTPEELESASVGFHSPSWEQLPDEVPPMGVDRYPGLNGWLPVRP